MKQAHFRDLDNVYTGGNTRRCKECEHRHAIHMVSDRLCPLVRIFLRRWKKACRPGDGIPFTTQPVRGLVLRMPRRWKN